VTRIAFIQPRTRLGYIERWEVTKTLVTFRGEIPRIASDFILIVNGIAIGAAIFAYGTAGWVLDRFIDGIRRPRYMYEYHFWPMWLWSVPCVTLYVAWVATLILLPLRDLVQLVKSDA
jgi:hypothetical protein